MKNFFCIRCVSLLTAFAFFSNQVVLAEVLMPPEPYRVQPVQAAEEVRPPDRESGALPLPESTTTGFLLGDLSPLSVADAAGSKASSDTLEAVSGEYERERYAFEDALDLMRPDYAAAVIVKDITGSDLKKLAALSVETAVIVLHGEIVLVTSGSSDEIGLLPAATELIEKATFVSHTHTDRLATAGPSGADLNRAGDRAEYVITRDGVYAYDQRGVLDNGEPHSYDQYLERLREAVEATQSEQDQIAARQDLNQFIAAQDDYNRASEGKREIFRMGGTLSYGAGLKSSSVTKLPGSPFPYITTGSSAGTSLSYTASASQFNLKYSVPSASNISGFTVSFDNATTTAVETRNISTLTNLVFGLKGAATSIKLEIVDVNNAKDTFALTGVSSQTERFWQVPVSAILNTLDKTRIKEIHFIVAQVNTTSAARTGTVSIRSLGLNTSVPSQPVLTSSVPSISKQTAVTLSGTKEANTAIFVGTTQVAARDDATTWSATVNLAAEGNNTLSITARNSIGLVSTAKTVTIRRDTVSPTGGININSGALYAATQPVTLSLSASDATSGISTMSFSQDNVSWSAPEAYATSRTYTLTAGDGNKTVYVKYCDKAGNASAVYSKSIILDTAAPTGTITVNGGAPFINQTAVTLNLSAADVGSGLDKMSFSSDNITWKTAEAYAVTKAWTFGTGDGNKTVYVKFQDKSGKSSAPVSVTVSLDTKVPSATALLINSGAPYTNSRNVTLSLTAADAGSGLGEMRFSPDGGVNWSGWEVFAPEKTFQLQSGDGTKEVRFQVKDKAGNVSSLVSGVSDSIVLDMTPPAIVLNAAIPALINTRSLTVSYTADGTAKTQAFSDLTEGINHLSVSATDLAGNVSVKPFEVTVDTTPPEIIFTSPQNVTDPVYALSYTADGVSVKETRILAVAGENVLTVTRADAAGNVSQKTFTVTLAPSPDGETPAPDAGFRLTTANGEVLNYLNGQLTGLELTDGAVASRLETDADGNLLNAFVRITDGSLEVLQNGTSLVYRRPDGSHAYYDHGELSKIVTGEGLTVVYSYLKDTGGNILEVTTESDLDRAVYGPEGKLSVSVDKQTGRRTEYENGMLTRVTDGSGSELLYTRTLLNGEYTVTPVLAQSPLAEYSLLKYDAQTFLLKEARDKSGRTFFFTNGQLTGVLDASGHAVSVSIIESPLANITDLRVMQNGLSADYGSGGQLRRVVFGDLTVYYKTDSEAIDHIEKQDGTELCDLTFDADGSLAGAVIVDPSGTERTYQEGALTRVLNPDATELFFMNEQITSMITPDQFTYRFDYTPEKIIASLDPANVPVPSTVVRMEYDLNLNLKTMVKQNQEIIRFADDRPFRIEVPGGEPQVYTYEKDGFGNVTATRITQGNVETLLDAQNRPVRSWIHATATSPDSYEVMYAYGKIREIYKNGALTFKYSYQFEDGGAELTVIEDLEEGAIKIYHDELLRTSFHRETSVLSTFSHSGGKVASVVVGRLGRTLHTYAYAYSGSDTIVTDETGVVRTYGEDHKLSFLEKDGEKFSYKYFLNDENEEITEERLIERKLSDGSRVHYEASGHPGRIDLPDGSKITEIVLDQDRKVTKATLTDAQGARHVFNGGALLESFYPDGTHTLYKDGRISTVEDAAGRALAYRYETDVQGNLTAAWIVNEDPMLSGGLPLDGSNVILDESGEDRFVGAKGNAQIDTAQAKFGAGSAFFDGSGDSFSVANSPDLNLNDQDFTIDTWVRLTSRDTSYHVIAEKFEGTQSGYSLYTYGDGTVYFYVDSGAVNLASAAPLSLNAWHHIAVVRSGMTWMLFIDGKKAVSATRDHPVSYQATPMKIGSRNGTDQWFKGWIDEFRLSVGTARWTSDFAPLAQGSAADAETRLLLHFDHAEHHEIEYAPDGSLRGVQLFGVPDGIDGSKDFTDSSAGHRVVTAHGDAGLNQDLVKFGEAAAFFDGSGDYISVPDSTDFDLGSGNFTIDAWINLPQVTTDPNNPFGTHQIICEKYTGSQSGYSFFVNPGGELTFYFDGSHYTTKKIMPDVWHHVAVVRQGSNFRFYVDGIQEAALVSDKTISNQVSAFRIGSRNGTDFWFRGSMDEFRFSKGKARWTGSRYTMPVNEYAADSYTKLLLHFERPSDSYYAYAKDSIGVRFTSAKGTFSFNTDGVLLLGPDPAIGARLERELDLLRVIPMAAYQRGFSALDPGLAGWFRDASEAVLDPDTVIAQEYSAAGILETQTRADRTVTLYENNKPVLVLDETGNVLIEYSYDPDGNPTRVFLKNARAALPREVALAKARVEEERAKALLAIVEAKQRAYQEIKAKADAARAQLWPQICQLQQQIRNLENTDVHGSKNKKAKSRALDQGRSALDQAWAQWEDLHRNEADAYAKLEQEALNASNKVNDDAAAVFLEILKQEVALKREILYQETAPIIYHYYRQTLGRDPSQAEYEYWINRVNYDSGETNVEILTTDGTPLTQALITHLLSLEELTERRAYVAAVKQRVTAEIQGYLGLSLSERQTFAASLGLSSAELIALTSPDAEKILTWLNSRTLHFGQSAFLALESLFDQKGIAYNREDIAVKTILIDILTGVITPLDDGDLVLSIYALNKTASLYGLDLTGAKLSYDQLLSLYESRVPSDEPLQLIAHINGNHFVVVTAVTADSVTYIDTGIGRDKQNESVTVTKDGFLKAWRGYVTGESSVIASVATQSQILTRDQSQAVRGAFFGSLLNLIGVILSFTPLAFLTIPFLIAGFVTSLIEGDWMSAISSVVGVAFVAFDIGSIFSGVFSGIKGALGSVGAFFGNLFQPVAGFFSGIAQVIPGFSSDLASGILSFAVGAGVSYGVSKGLTMVGVSPELAGFAGSLVSGVVMGGMSELTGSQIANGLTQSDLIRGSALGTVTLSGVGRLGMELGLDSGLTSLIGLSLGAIQGNIIQNPGSTLEQAFKNVLPSISSSLAYFGVDKLGTSLGLPASISGLIGATFSSTVGQLTDGLINSNGGGGPGSIFNIVKDSIFSSQTLGGMISIGASLAIDQLGLPPLASELVSGFIAGFGQTELGEKVFSKIGEGISRFTGWITDGIRPVIDFGVKILNGAAEITEAGFKSAINAFGSFFSRPTQEYIYQDVAGIRSGSVSVDGDIWTWQSGDSRIDYNVTTGRVSESLVGVGGGIAKIDGLSQNASGNYYYSKLESSTLFDGGILSQSYENGKLTEWGLLYPDGTSVASRGSAWDAEGNIITGDVEIHAPPVIIQGPAPDPNPTNPPQTYIPYSWTFTIQNGQVVDGKADYQIEASGIDSGAAAEDPAQPLYLLANGINNTDYPWGEPMPDPARYYSALRSDLLGRNQALTLNDIVAPALYPSWVLFRQALDLVSGTDPNQTWWQKFLKSSDTVLNRFKDVARILFEVQLTERFGIGGLTTVIDDAMDQRYELLGESSILRPLIALGYSGGMPALVNAIAENAWYTPVLVGVGAALSNIAEISDWLNSVMGLLDYFAGKIAGSKTVENTIGWLQKVFGCVDYIPVLGQTMLAAAEFLTGLITGTVESLDQAIDFVIDAVGILCDDWRSQGKIAPLGISSLAGSGTQCFVNIFGESDVLAKLRIGGKIDTFAGLSGPEELFNVQIMNLTSSTGEKLASADHYIYMGDIRRDYADQRPDQKDFDVAAKNFVADLIAYGGTTAEEMKKYLRGDPRVRFDEATQTYRVYPMGVPQ